MLFFERLQLAHQYVILGVRNLRRIHHVIQVFMMTYFIAQLFYAVSGCTFSHEENYKNQTRIQ